MEQSDRAATPPEDYDYLKASSVQDCTGLIPSAVQDDAELESYEELYPFLPKVILPEDPPPKA